MFEVSGYITELQMITSLKFRFKTLSRLDCSGKIITLLNKGTIAKTVIKNHVFI